MAPFDATSGPHRPTPPPDPWAQLGLALALLAVDPRGLRGLWLRGRAGPVRDRVLAALAPLAPRKLHPFMPEDALTGGLDLSATLALNRLHRHDGLLARDGTLALTMAERCPPGLSVRLGQALDTRPGLSLIALDEAAEEGEGLPTALADRLALFLDIDGFGWSDSADITLDPARTAAAQAHLPKIALPPETLEQMTRIAASLGIDSLRAPWQAMRRAARPDASEGRLLLMPGDIRIKRYQDRTDRVLIFVVDASGSAAVARLAEAKGAVEIMLAEAYSARDHVALITFRGDHAELALPPTRSLVQAKRRLAGLPGGRATPLASTMQVALDASLQARARGMSPTLAFLTDGRGNIALDGSANRTQAAEDATRLARAIAARAIPALVIDTSLRPKPQLSELAATMGATRIALPRADARADARAMAQTLGAALGGKEG